MRPRFALLALLLALVATGCFVGIQGPVEDCGCPPQEENPPP